MRPRPVRPNIFKPLPRLGVNASDWKYVGLVSFVCFIVPFILGIWAGHLPLGAITGPLSFAMSVAFFNAIHKGKKPNWTSHNLKAISQRWAPYRRAQAGDYSDNSWLITSKQREP